MQPNPCPVSFIVTRRVLSGFAEFSFLHTLTDEPVDERALAVHHIEFSVKTVPCLCDGGGVGTILAMVT
jgi:hypothetical protein